MSSKLTFLIVHGAYGNPEGNWFVWLKAKLEKSGHIVFAPTFPTPEGQDFNNWLRVSKATLANHLPEKTVLIGHSTGSIFVLRLAEQTKQPYKAVFSVCPFAVDLGLPEFDPLNASFIYPAFNWEHVKAGARNIYCLAGDNDPYVPLSASQRVAEAIDSQLTIVPNGGHLNADTGYREFPLLLEKIQENL